LIKEEGKMSNYRNHIRGSITAYAAISGIRAADSSDATGLTGAESYISFQTSVIFQRLLAGQANGINSVSDRKAGGNATLVSLCASPGNNRKSYPLRRVPICFDQLPAKNDE